MKASKFQLYLVVVDGSSSKENMGGTVGFSTASLLAE